MRMTRYNDLLTVDVPRPLPLHCWECGRLIPPEVPDAELTFDLSDPGRWFHLSCASRVDVGDAWPSNLVERECGQVLVSLGIKPHRRGYPDFWWVDTDGRLCFAEVKPNQFEKLRRDQLAFCAAVRRAGCGVFRYDPLRGLQEIQP
jgi:hypothetical protein